MNSARIFRIKSLCFFINFSSYSISHEKSVKLKKVLKSKGYEVIEKIEGEYELVLLLNVLDRCEAPITILEQIKKVKKKYLLVSIVLPFKGFYTSGTKQMPQEENFMDYFKNWEESVNILNKKFENLGFEVLTISRLPYLSEGNFNKYMYFLDTVVFLLKN